MKLNFIKKFTNFRNKLFQEAKLFGNLNSNVSVFRLYFCNPKYKYKLIIKIDLKIGLKFSAIIKKKSKYRNTF